VAAVADVLSVKFVPLGIGAAVPSRESARTKAEAVQLTKDFLSVAGDGERDLGRLYENTTQPA
jgi:hypothetical protein